ncbi:MAG: transposase [Chloroflexota bacterium]
MRGKKSDWHPDPQDPPRKRANKRRGRGTYANDRPPICGVIGRKSRQVRIRVMKNTQGKTLCPFVEKFTHPETILYTDEYDSYNKLKRVRHTVCHSKNEWARDDDGDGIREVHVNSNEGCWTGLRNFLRPFRGVHKKYLAGYVAIHEFAVNHKVGSPDFISIIVRSHLS